MALDVLAILKKPPFFFSPGTAAGALTAADSGGAPDAADVVLGRLPPVAFSILSSSICSLLFSFSLRLATSSELFFKDRLCIATSFLRFA